MGNRFAGPGLALGAACFAAALLLTYARRRGAAPPPAPPPPRSGDAARAAARLMLPTCSAPAGRELPAPELSFQSGARLEMSLPADGRTARSEARFTVDPRRGTLRPANAEARRLADIRTGCP